MSAPNAVPTLNSIFQYPPNFPNGQVADIWDAYFQSINDAFATAPPILGAVAIADLIDHTLPAKGAGMVGYNVGLAYPASTLGKGLTDLTAALTAYEGLVAGSTGAAQIGYLAPYTGAVARTQDDKNSDTVNVKDFGAIGDGITDDTASFQSAINAVAANNVALMTDNRTYMVSGLTIPSNLTWRMYGTVIKLITGSNKPVLANSMTAFTPGAITNANIDISGGIIDGNGLNQSDNCADGSPVVGVRFFGVSNLKLDITVQNSRRYAYWLGNCNHVRGNAVAFWSSSYTSATNTPNRDGVHINGNTYDFQMGAITVTNSGDDAFPLNADDVNSGGSFTQANISGPIIGVSVDHIYLNACFNGLRLLSANYECSDVNIGQVVGSVNYYGLMVQAYGLGTSSFYRNIHIENLSLTYTDSSDAGRSSTALIWIDTSTPNPTYVSNFSFGTIDRSSTGSDTTSLVRDTMHLILNRCTVKVNKITERGCVNDYTVQLTDAGATTANVEFDLDRHQRSGSSASPSTGFYGTTLHVVQIKAVAWVRVGYIEADSLRNGIIIDGATVTNLDCWHSDTATNYAIWVGSTSTVNNMVARGVPSTMFYNAPYVVDGTSSVLGIGVTNDTGPWNTVTAFSNSWTSLGAPYAAVGYRKTPGGMVELQGILQNGTVNLAAFTLPAGFRPANMKAFGCITSTASQATLKISNAGVVMPSDNTTTYIVLDGITFRAEG